MEQKTKTYTCQHCGRTFTDCGQWMSHDCDEAQPVTIAQRNTIAIVGPMTPAQRDTVAMLYNAPRCQVEESGDMLWA